MTLNKSLYVAVCRAYLDHDLWHIYNHLSFSTQFPSCSLYQCGREGFGCEYEYADKVTKINN